MNAETLILRMSRNGVSAQEIADMAGLAWFDVRRVQLGGPLVVPKPKPEKKPAPRRGKAWERLAERKKVRPPTGRCLQWLPEKGDYCGAPCKGQRCHEHKHMTLPAGNSLSTSKRHFSVI